MNQRKNTANDSSEWQNENEIEKAKPRELETKSMIFVLMFLFCHMATSFKGTHPFGMWETDRKKFGISQSDVAF